jgi:DNA-binding NarL/FixJ family response regulator
VNQQSIDGVPFPALGESGAIDELVRRNLESQSQVRLLAEANLNLRRRVAAEAYKHQTIMHALAGAAERLGDGPMMQIIRTVAAAPSDLPLKAPETFGDGSAQTTSEPNVVLSRREREVLALLANGTRSPCIATDLGITIATVEVHRRNIMRKLGLHNIAALTKYAVRQGLSSL